jgi:hypothetical protein
MARGVGVGAVTCEGCSKPDRGIYIAGCRGCSLRSILRSPEHARARSLGKLTPEYCALLAPLGDPVRVHLEEVKPMVLRGEV